MDTRTLLRERLRRSRDWTQTIDELEKELEASGTKPEQSERLFELGQRLQEAEDHATAKKYLDEASGLDGSNPLIKRAAEKSAALVPAAK